MHSPFESHMEAVKRILRYLKGSPRRGLLFRKQESRSVNVLLMLIGLDAPNTDALHQGTILMFLEISLHEEVKNNMWLLEVVLRLN